MPATTTRLISRIWGEYYSNYLPDDSKEDNGQELKYDEVEEEEEENEEEDTEEVEEQKILLPKEIKKSQLASKHRKTDCSTSEIVWDGETVGKTCAGEAIYKQAIVRGNVVVVGGSVLLVTANSNEYPPIYFVEYMFEDFDARKLVHGRVMLRGFQTVVGNTANEREVFLTNDCLEFELSDVKEPVVVETRLVPCAYQHRKDNANRDKIERARAEDRKCRGLPMEYFCKNLYWPERGAFVCLHTDKMGLGTGHCHSCKIKQSQNENVFMLNPTMTSFAYHGTEYQRIQGTMKLFKSGRNVGVKAYVVFHMLEIKVLKSPKQADPETVKRAELKYDKVEEEENEEEDIKEVEEQKILLPQEIKKPQLASKHRKTDCSTSEIVWDGEAVGKTCAEYVFEDFDARKLVHGRVMLRGFQTVLGNTANEREVFLTNDCLEFELSNVMEPVVVETRLVPCAYQHRKANANRDKIERARAEDRKCRGLPMEILYWLERGAFVCLLTDKMGLVPKSSKQADPEIVKVKVGTFFRPQDISTEKAYRSDVRESPACINLNPLGERIINNVASKKIKGKYKGENGLNVIEKQSDLKNCLATLGFFAGCGGLSEGLQQSGVSVTKWAIEYDEPVGEAFNLNHPEAFVRVLIVRVEAFSWMKLAFALLKYAPSFIMAFCLSKSSISALFSHHLISVVNELKCRAIMTACEDADDCISTSEAAELAAKLDEKKINIMPRPGQVDFINGGPPCLVYSSHYPSRLQIFYKRFQWDI
ncbi:unnamed protein product [Ilex paraguariensis]|uniref:BAH domain-containing protein n=1 Tax=Ilex paraguariensis TaxID=185542 RepID=A0ABC8RBU3_9AQUA